MFLYFTIIIIVVARYMRIFHLGPLSHTEALHLIKTIWFLKICLDVIISFLLSFAPFNDTWSNMRITVKQKTIVNNWYRWNRHHVMYHQWVLIGIKRFSSLRLKYSNDYHIKQIGETRKDLLNVIDSLIKTEVELLFSSR